MSLRNGGIKLIQRVARHVDVPVAILPQFLCPGILNGLASRHAKYCQFRRHLHTTEASQKREGVCETSFPSAYASEPVSSSNLPVQCPGCGALSQVVGSEDAGFYTLTRRSVKEYFRGVSVTTPSREREIFEKSVSALEASQDVGEESKKIIGELGSAFSKTSEKNTDTLETPLCDRCHNLKHHYTGVPIHHPSVQSIQDTIFESPHKYNHVYHVVDAADFPMSLVQGLHRLLQVAPQRSLNRRSQTGKFYHGKKTEISFVITRSDLLAPTKVQVDRLMPYLRDVLRDALGRAAQDARLGNVRCVSAKRQWWTKELKEEIWHRGGGGWMVGKVNVGKSQLFQEVFPKGRMADWGKHTTTLGAAVGLKQGMQSIKDAREATQEFQEENFGRPATERVAVLSDPVESEGREQQTETLVHDSTETAKPFSGSYQDKDHLEAPQSAESEALSSSAQAEEYSQTNEPLNTNSLLPPLPTEMPYPAMPLVSSLPGTTASPIRIPFGNGKGELVDLPGLSRGDLEKYVLPQHQASLVMTSRITPEQYVLKPGQSILLGGFIRITPTTPDVYILHYNFTRLTAHQTSTTKAIGIQTGSVESNVVNIALPGTEEKIASAGKFHLKYDITKERSGPLTRKDAVGISVERLPYRVLGTDILIEGVGWIELACQVRKPYGDQRHRERQQSEEMQEEETDSQWPEIEVFTPEGKFVAQRRPMNAWLMLGNKPGKDTKARPRRAMKGTKKAEKRRAAQVRATYPL